MEFTKHVKLMYSTINLVCIIYCMIDQLIVIIAPPHSVWFFLKERAVRKQSAFHCVSLSGSQSRFDYLSLGTIEGGKRHITPTSYSIQNLFVL